MKEDCKSDTHWDRQADERFLALKMEKYFLPSSCFKPLIIGFVSSTALTLQTQFWQ